MSGMNGISVNSLAKKIDKKKREMAEEYSKEDLFESLHSQLMEKNNTSSDVLNIYIYLCNHI